MKHDKFKAYWESIGKPDIEIKCKNGWVIDVNPFMWGSFDYRIAGDSHWQVRLEWVNSGKTLKVLERDNHGWVDAGENPSWWQSTDYKILRSV